jgi:hypothetical protein
MPEMSIAPQSTDKGTTVSPLSGYSASEPSQTTAPMLVQTTGVLRTQLDSVGQQLAVVHQEMRDRDLAQRAAVKGRNNVASLLAELAADRGMAWADIARLINVSVSAIRKWRTNQPASADHRLALAKLAAFLDLLSEYAIEDPAQWMEMRLPLPAGYTFTPLDIYQSGASAVLLDYASQRCTAEEMLDRIDDSWRNQRSQFESYNAPDGEKAIRIREK